MSQEMTHSSKTEARLHRADGFSFPELLIVVAIISIVSSMALMSFQKSNKNFQLAGAARNFSGYLEKARLDSVRRHGGASVNINSATSYTVNMDFDGSGATTARTVALPVGTSLTYTLPPATTTLNPASNPITVTYDWRGRAGAAIVLTLTDSTTGVGSKTLVVGPAGDVSTDTTVTGPVTNPTPQTSVTTSSGIKSMQ
jgi:prepilin-type N-terminal cleavage/methylation domain-containing protein